MGLGKSRQVADRGRTGTLNFLEERRGFLELELFFDIVNPRLFLTNNERFSYLKPVVRQD